MNKLLTITIPVYNTEKLLPKCVDSLVGSQFLDKLEILIVVDGSPDNSLQVARAYEARYPESIKAIDKENGGHGSTINKGIELAAGKYFRVLDSDDWFDTAAFDRYLTELETLDVDMVLGNYDRQFVFENLIDPARYQNVEYGKIYDSETFDYSSYKGDNLVVIHSVTYLTQVLRRSELKLPEKCFYTDVLYSQFVMPTVKTFLFSEPSVYQYYIGREGQSISKTGFRKNAAQHRKVCLECAKFVEEYLQYSTEQGTKMNWVVESLTQKAAVHMVSSAILMKFGPAYREVVSYKKELRTRYPSVYAIGIKHWRTTKLINRNSLLGVISVRAYQMVLNLKRR